MKIKSGGAIVASVLVLAGPALSADLYPKASPAPTTYDWSGVYVGGHAGGGRQTTAITDPDLFSNLINCCVLLGVVGNPTGISDSTGSGFLGGVQAGWMYQIGRLVVGADVDWSGTDLKGTGVSTVPGGSSESYSVRANWTTTATATVGLARERWMLYSKAGVAAANEKYGLSISGVGGFGPGPFAFSSTATDTATGWTVGTGVKYAFSDNWIVNVEYDFLDFDSQTHSISGAFTAAPAGIGLAATFNPDFRQYISEVKIGLSYKFAPGFLFW
ncbi:MAG: outer membrane beta-barrel protein [Xanthobacteraceae bacterium]